MKNILQSFQTQIELTLKQYAAKDPLDLSERLLAEAYSDLCEDKSCEDRLLTWRLADAHHDDARRHYWRCVSDTAELANKNSRDIYLLHLSK